MQLNHNVELSKILDVLKRYKEKFFLNDWKISPLSLEDVFFRSLNNSHTTVAIQEPEYQESITKTTSYPKINSYSCSPVNLKNKFILTLEKKYKILRYTSPAWIAMIAIFYLLFALTFVMNDSGYKDFHRDGSTLPLTLNTYGCTNVYYQSNGDMEIERMFEYLISSSSSKAHKVQNLPEAVIEVGSKNIVEYRRKLIVGAKLFFETDLKKITVLYGNQAHHGAPISLNLISNFLLKYLNQDNYSIEAFNTPLRSVKSSIRQTNVYLADNLIYWMLLLSNACLFSVAMFSAIPILERNSFITMLSKLYNLRSHCYWINTYVSDIIIYLLILIPPIIIICILSSFDLILLQISGVGALAIILIWYGLTIIPHIYFESLFSKSISSAVAWLLISNMSVSPILSGIIISLESSDLPTARAVLYICSVLSPHTILTYTLGLLCYKMVKYHNWDMKTLSQKEMICKDIHVPCCDPESTECAEDRLYIPDWQYLVISVIFGLLLVCICIIFDQEKTHKLEKSNDCAVGAKKINKEYKTGIWRKSVQAIDNFSFRVKKGECFGLLGVNGAGKSTLYKILTNQEKPTKGNVIRDETSNIGYCPQDHAVLNCLTGHELLTYFGKLRNENITSEEIDNLLDKCGLYEYRNRLCGTYSGGNKRKLNTCIALIGKPDIITLDEPTTGVDPENRRKIKELIKDIKAEKTSAIVFTSHSMDECEELCDRLAIMKAGVPTIEDNLTALELKEKYNAAHVVQIKTTGSQRTESILKHLQSLLFGAKIESISDTNDILTVSIKNSDWTSIFTAMNLMQSRDDVLNYHIKAASLEEIFLKIARSDSLRVA